MKVNTFTKSLVVLPPGVAVYSDRATTVSIEDEAGGPFVSVGQEVDTCMQIRIDAEEWPQIRAAIDAQFDVCRQLVANEDADEDAGAAEPIADAV